MIASGATIDLASLPAELLPALVRDALPQARAKRLLDSITAAIFPHMHKNDRRALRVQLKAQADPSWIDRLRTRSKGKDRG